MKDAMQEAQQTFVAESRELLEAMETALLEMAGAQDQTQVDAEAVNAVFRAAHTIKGSAGLFGLDRIVRFTHVMESVLDRVRDGSLALHDDLVALLLSCADHSKRQIDAVDSATLHSDDMLEADGKPLMAGLQCWLDGSAAAPLQPPPATAAEAAATAQDWRIALRFGPEVLRNGMDPAAFLRYLTKLGEIESIVTQDDMLPAFEAYDAEVCYLGFEIRFRSSASQAEIAAVFEFVQDDCTLRIEPANSSAVEAARADKATPSPVPMREARAAREAKPADRPSVRVDADKLDRLIDQVGELVIAVASANLAARRVRSVELQECNATLASLVQEVRDSALQLRMVKIGATFSRFQRVVHDVARELGKDIALQVSGEDTELDKTVVEMIGDPLTHLVRNAMDHGIEPTEARLAKGKPAQGKVLLNAFHDSGSIIIEVSDDGGGLKRDRILAKAVERGLVEAGKPMSDREIYNLIFEAGFSTAETVTNLSGRGVGMDVVKRNITALRGSVDISSSEGAGTTVTVRLPLTLAIIDGFQVGVGRSVFVIPLEMVDECVAYSAEAGHEYTDLRGQVLPFIRLRDLFELGGEPAVRQNIVVVKHAEQKFGLVVDSLLGEVQTVIKPLSKMFARVMGISGSSILGSGDVALILDVPALLKQTQTTPARHPCADSTPQRT
jgi:two-component system chemotaxis sensor kinase CheA